LLVQNKTAGETPALRARENARNTSLRRYACSGEPLIANG